MRALFLLRGCPGSGKSTFIKQNNLTEFTIEIDAICKVCRVPITDPTILFDEKKMNEFKQYAEERMQNNELIIVDGVHCTSEKIEKYFDLLDKYQYDFYCIDFSDIPIEKCKLQNKMRIRSKWIAETSIDRKYKQLQEQILPSNLKVITRNEFLTLFNSLKKDR